MHQDIRTRSDRDEKRIRERDARDTLYRAWTADRPKPKPRKRPRPSASGPVTITRRDGSTVVAPAYTPEELLRVAPERLTVSEAMRQRILARDNHACRYCGKPDRPFHIDHVLPVAHGGPTTMRNLVTACETCNLRKGTAHWKPNPLPRRRR